MPLFRISVLALLLLPLCLSCDSYRSPADVRSDYNPVVETELNNTIRHITTLLQNKSCKEVTLNHKLPTCRSNVTNILGTLHNLTCKMKNLRVAHTDKLTGSVLTSLRCPCLDRPTKEPSVNWRRTTTTGSRRNEQRKSHREMKKLCRALAILSKMTECYQILNTIFGTN